MTSEHEVSLFLNSPQILQQVFIEVVLPISVFEQRLSFQML